MFANALSSFKEMSTGKKIATVAGTTAVVAGVGLTAAALYRGGKISRMLNGDVLTIKDKTLTWKNGTGKTKFFEKLKEGFKSIFKKAGEDNKYAEAKTYIANQAEKLLNFTKATDEAGNQVGKFSEEITSDKQLRKLIGMLKRNGNDAQVNLVKDDAFQKAKETTIETFKKAIQEAKKAAAQEAPAVDTSTVDAQTGFVFEA